MSNYHPEPYWSEVAKKIKSREGKNVIAGDDEPYYRYKRQEFLRLLNEVDFAGKSVLEIGNGPGGNLKEVWNHKPKSLTGVDISAEMIEIAKQNVAPEIRLVKIDGTRLPFSDKSFDTVFTATVLQHNTDEKMLHKILSEICRVSRTEVLLFERIEKTVLGDELCFGRPVEYYKEIMEKHGFRLETKKFINTRVSYYMAGISRKLLNSKSRKEGDPLSSSSMLMQKLLLPPCKLLDKIFTSQKDIARLIFVRK